MKEQIGGGQVTNVEEFHDVLKQLTCADPDVIYVTNEKGEPVTLRLFEEKLTDGAIVYNIVVS